MNREDLTFLEAELGIVIYLHPDFAAEAEKIRMDMLREGDRADRKLHEKRINELYSRVYCHKI